MRTTRRNFLALNALAPLAIFAHGNAFADNAPSADDALPSGEKWLTALPLIPVLSQANSPLHTHVLSGIIASHCIINHDIYSVSKSITADLGQHYRSLKGVIGIDKSVTALNPLVYSIELDGKTLIEGKLEDGGKPIFFSLDITGGRSLNITLATSVGIGNVIVSKKALGENKEDEDTPSLIEPSPGAKITEENVLMKWKPVAGVNVYLVQVLQTKRLGKRRMPDVRGWTFTVTNQTSYTWDLKDIPSGDYLWSVLAFEDDQVKGVFSVDRKFTVVR